METPRPEGRTVGQPIKRVEDGRLLVGQGRFVDDLHLPRMVHAAFVRSPRTKARPAALCALVFTTAIA